MGITTGARTSFLRASHRWSEVIHLSLCYAALKHYVNLRDTLPTKFTLGVKQGRTTIPDKHKCSPLSQFLTIEVEPNIDTFWPFGSPSYVLRTALQAQHSHNKWPYRSQVGIFMCHSPRHSSSVPLVLNTQTDNVTPKFHCIYDDKFDTCKKNAKFKSLWQCKAKLFEKQKETFSYAISIHHITSK